MSHTPKKETAGGSRLPTVLLSIEHKEREFLPKCLLALHFAKSGFRVYLGSTEAVDELAMRINPSVYLHKSTHPKSPAFKAMGHVFAVLDEEGGVTTPVSTVEEFCFWRYSTVDPGRQDLILLPSKRWSTAVSKMSNVDDVAVKVTGWPRVDLWRSTYSEISRSEVDHIQRTEGNFYLFPTSFGGGHESSFKEVIDSSPNEMFRQIQLHKFRAFKTYTDLVREIAPNLPQGTSLVIRPHPSEKLSEWKEAMAGVPNVKIIREGDIAPWILGAQALLQFGSTTVTQAAMNGKLNVQYRIEHVEGITDSPSFELALEATTPEEVLSLLGRPDEKLEEIRERALAVLESEMDYSDEQLAVTKVVDAISSVALPAIRAHKLGLSLRARLFALHFGSGLRHIMRKVGVLSFSGKTIFENIPGGINSAQVEDAMLRMAKAETAPAEFVVLNVGRNLVAIEPLKD